MNISISKTIFSVGLVSIAACAIIPVGGSLAMLAELNGYIAANGYEQYTMEAMDLFKGRGMSLLVLILYTTLFSGVLKIRQRETRQKIAIAEISCGRFSGS